MAQSTPTVIYDAPVPPEPHLVGEDGRVLAIRTWAIRRIDAPVGCSSKDRPLVLLSPMLGSVWWDNSKTAHDWDDSEAVLGVCGLHAVRYRERPIPLVPETATGVVACWGRIAFSPHGLRAEKMEIIRLYLSEEDRRYAPELRKRYRVPVRVLKVRRNGASVLLSTGGEVFVKFCRHGRITRTLSQNPDGEYVIHSYDENYEFHGKQIHYRPSVPLTSTPLTCCETYRHGVLHGPALYYESSEKYLRGRHVNGKRHGRWEWMLPDGKTYIYYDQDVQVFPRWRKK